MPPNRRVLYCLAHLGLTVWCRLVLKGRNREALTVLSALADLPEDDPTVQNEYNAVLDTVQEMAQGSFADCFKMNPNRNFHRTMLGYIIQVFQQVCSPIGPVIGERDEALSQY